MNLVVRLLLILAGSLAALFVAEDALNFPIWQGVMALLLIGIAAILVALFRPRA